MAQLPILQQVNGLHCACDFYTHTATSTAPLPLAAALGKSQRRYLAALQSARRAPDYAATGDSRSAAAGAP
jgi:hypothetical protein